ncbi:unnamed protein product [Didymodactylos carnosus]|uniref:Uncharacterized protein n=1 Tax=Didymodactylos carnosus TaxID=1234261 RepID=A0A815QQM9_9BILA|nr:unnamed protein product [Didymodactylos carnosus]CAF1541622.1 unnamed protein product [Didymodactylos carnosus]CAF4330043.1 unnamed protein product [Didymodactylos carnosus]CAF4335613.1 unnamed protein product [Didymodactylos carnosus]
MVDPNNQFQKQLDEVVNQAKRYTSDIEIYTKEHVDDPPEQLEAELHLRINNFRQDITQQLNNVNNSITQHRPIQGQNDPDYENKRQKYKEFLTESNRSINKMKETLDNLLTKIVDVIKQVIIWLAENLPKIVDAIIKLYDMVIKPLMEQYQRRP